MERSTQRIFEEVSRLSPLERAELIDHILASFDGKPDEETQRAWVAEAQKRLDEINNGKAAILSEEEVFSEIEKGRTK